MSQYNCLSGSLYGIDLQPWHTGCLCSYTDSCWMKTDCPIAKQNSTKSWNLRCLKSFIPVYNLEWKAGFVLSLMKTGSDVCIKRKAAQRTEQQSHSIPAESEVDSAHERPCSEPVGGAPGSNWARVIHILRLSRQHLRHSLQFTEHV